MDKRKLFYLLSPKFRFLVRRIYFLPIDILNTIFKRRHPLEPPKGLIYTGYGDFIEHGKIHLGFLIKYAGLQPNHRVLDVGSGIGRTAVALTSYLDSNGSYEGFDAVKLGVDYCIRKITSKYPNFKFKFVDLKNDLYKSTGTEATKYKFDYNDNEFDIVFLMSVFTHMSMEEIEHYLNEIKRVLKPNGKCLSTFFYFDQSTLDRMDKNLTDINFQVDYGNCRLMDDEVKSANICIELDYLKKLILNSGFKIEKNIDGYWRQFENQNGNYYQDMIIFSK